MSGKFCIKCGKEIDAEAKACPYCGGDQPPSATTDTPASFAVAAKKKRWPWIVGLGVGLVLVAGLILILTGVINFGSPAPAFAIEDLPESWAGEVTLDNVSGSGSEAERLRQYIGDTQTIDMELKLNADGTGSAKIDGGAVSAQLNGSTLKLDGVFSSGETFNATGNITKQDGDYEYSGTYSMARSGITIQGKINFSPYNEPTTTFAPVASASTDATDSGDAPSDTIAPSDDGTASISLENTWVYKDAGGLIRYTFKSDGTYNRYFANNVDDSSVSEDGTYDATGDTIRLKPNDGDSYELGYKISGTSMTIVYEGQSQTFSLDTD